MNRPLLPGATMGVMGGGQLGRMFVHAAQAMGYQVAVLDPDPISPAGRVADVHIQTPYDDEQGLAQLMQRAQAITTEFENVPAPVLFTLGAQRVVAPAADAVAVCQDRALEKACFARCGVPCAPHAVIDGEASLAEVGDELLPGILKTASLGYDGKGQVTVANRAELAAAWVQLKNVRCVLEKRLSLQRELSVVLARDAFGNVVNLPVQQNLHRDGILAVTEVPAPDIPAAVQQQAVQRAGQVAQALQYVGVLCVEFFLLADGSLVANEMAPRPHNSGHYSIDACDLDQFQLQARVLAGLPLAAPRQHSPAVMLNLLGDLWWRDGAKERQPDWAALVALPGTHLHLYGKNAARPGRKMGHLTITAATPAQAREVALQCAALLGIAPF